VVENFGGVSSVKKVFLFYRAYTKWQQSSEIKILQTFLESQGLYSGTIDGIYTQATMNAVYELQKKYNLISDSDPLSLRGFLGPKTRAKINELRTK
jgi:peptidoglycan hydrolase-like protein with peptidoglycan-binding domain